MLLIAVGKETAARLGMKDIETIDVLLVHDAVGREQAIGLQERIDDTIITRLVDSERGRKRQLPTESDVAPLREDDTVIDGKKRKIIPEFPFNHNTQDKRSKYSRITPPARKRVRAREYPAPSSFRHTRAPYSTSDPPGVSERRSRCG